MKYKSILLLALIFWSCQDVKRPEIPLDLIPEDQMAEILTEIYLINAARSFDNRVIMKQKIKLDSFFFRKFNIDSLQFVESNAYYTSNLATYNRLFTKVEERMKFLKTETDTLLAEHARRLKAKLVQDSIEKAKRDTTMVVQKDSLELKKADSLMRTSELKNLKKMQ